MTDIEVDFEAEEDYDEEEVPGGEGTAEAEGDSEEKPKASKKHPVPEGWETPARMPHILKERDVCDISPQQMFGFVKNGKEFPKNEDGSPFLHTDGRYIVPIERTVDWVIAHLQKREERAAKRAQKEAEKANTDTSEE